MESFWCLMYAINTQIVCSKQNQQHHDTSQLLSSSDEMMFERSSRSSKDMGSWINQCAGILLRHDHFNTKHISLL